MSGRFSSAAGGHRGGGRNIGGQGPAAGNPYIALLVSGMAAAEPDVKPSDHLTPQGIKVLAVARDGGCLAEVFKAGEGLKNATS
ncbi:hypothetical protein [Streptomyces sp. NPDC056105]|uniref:hypothetical protein n=1 Tax=Streptomyces sp. NPDC056105 TaxID=3345714 RepID=UPI0035E10916